MKRIFIGFMICTAAIAAKAQTSVEGNKFTDNWSIGINAGGTTPFSHSAFFKNMRPVFGANPNKQFTPALGMTAEVMGSINTTPSSTAFDNASPNLLGRVNLEQSIHRLPRHSPFLRSRSFGRFRIYALHQ